jgi:hypothetical protein
MKTKEQAILNPEVGDRWIWPNGQTAQISSYSPAKDNFPLSWNCHGFDAKWQVLFAYDGEDFNAKVHNAKYLGNFALKKEKSPKSKKEALTNPELGDRWVISEIPFQIGKIESFDNGKTVRVYASSKVKEDQLLGIVGEDFNSKMCWYEFVGNFALNSI